jgi:hypothetical protein
VPGERSFPRGRVALIDLMASWRAVAGEVAKVSPDTPEWQSLADEARHRRILLDQQIADIVQGQLAFRQRHPQPKHR